MNITGALDIRYSLECPSPQKLFSELARSRIEARNITVHDEGVSLSVRRMQCRSFLQLMGKLNISCTVEEEGLLCRLPRMIGSRAGLFIGAAAWTAFTFGARDFMLSANILTENEDIRRSVLAVLEENDIKFGTYMPSINCAEVERDLKQHAEGISWAGISITDSTLVIDVIENTDIPEWHYERMPSNLVAKHSGTIESVELYSGLLEMPLGSGVLQGDLLVSGKLPVNEVRLKNGDIVTEEGERYVRSIGTVYGTYRDVQTFEQPYSEQSIVMNGRHDDRRYLCVFGAEIPLFIGGGEGLYRAKENFEPFTIIDFETPVGIKTVTREGFSFSRLNYTREQAFARADEQRQLYEQNFLSDEEIRSRDISTEYGKDSVKMTVTYDLYGVMSEEKQFFIRKQ